MKKQTHTFTDLINIMARLRAPDGCPWDRQQSYQDIAAHTLEETHEVLDAIDKQDMGALCEELGDLLLQVVFYAQIASEEQKFTINDIINGICNKIIHRHPHVFGDEKIDNADEVLKQWEMLKKKEGKKSAVGGVPNGLPALLQAFRLGEKTSRLGFDWDDASGILDKVSEEAKELHEARQENNPSHIEHEYGDLLFTLANLGRYLNIDPEGALRRANKRFIRRFTHMEKHLEEQQQNPQDLTLDEWDILWKKAKANESTSC